MSVRTFALALIVTFSLGSFAEARKYASIVVDVEQGHIIHDAHSETITHPASLTKMMTLYLVFSALRKGEISLDQKIPVSRHASRQQPTKLYLKAGSTVSVRDAIYGLVVKSANDASVALAEALGKTESQFAMRMTRQAKSLGMTRTVFKNASGLPNSKQVTTAKDMAILSIALYKDFPEYFKFFGTKKFTYKGKTYANHNRLLGKLPGMDGIKTGFVNASGFNLAASVQRGNKRLVAIVLGGRTSHTRNKHMVELIEAAYTKIRSRGAKLYTSAKQLVHKAPMGKIHRPRPARNIPLPPKKVIPSFEQVLHASYKPTAPVPVPPVRKVASLGGARHSQVQGSAPSSIESLILQVSAPSHSAGSQGSLQPL